MVLPRLRVGRSSADAGQTHNPKVRGASPAPASFLERLVAHLDWHSAGRPSYRTDRDNVGVVIQ